MQNRKKRTLVEFESEQSDESQRQVLKKVKKRTLKPSNQDDKYESDFICDSESEQIQQPDQDSELSLNKKSKNHKKAPKNNNSEDFSESDDEEDEEDDYDVEDDQIIEKKKERPRPPVKLQQIEESSEDDREDVYPLLHSTNKGSDYRFNPKDQKYYLPGDFSIPKQIFENLFDHQKVGVQWLYNLWEQNKGGILGDDMGLGKTVQIASYLKGMFDAEMIKKVLIIVPATMKSYWEEELKKWCADCTNIMQFDDKKKSNRYDQMKSVRKNGGILITSYGMVTTEIQNLTDTRYDVIVIDEGHKAKNKNTQFRRDITSLKVKGHRVILSGTPLQNNLSELWSVFDFVQPKIFGSFERFEREYTSKIEKGMKKDSTLVQKQISQQLSRNLRAIYQDHFLRRTKAQIFKVVCAETISRPLKISELPLKTDLVIWMPLTNYQKQIYKFIIKWQTKKQGGNGWEIKSAFSMLSYLKKFVLHPHLLMNAPLSCKKQIGYIQYDEEMQLKEQRQEIMQNEENFQGISTRRARSKAAEVKKVEKPKPKKVELEKDTKEDLERRKVFDKYNMGDILQDIEEMHKNVDVDKLIDVSVKTKFLFKLMENLKKEGHRVLIFSMSKKMLDLLELILNNKSQFKKDYKHLRIDGDTEIATRDGICKQFNSDQSIFCCLLTTKVGGFGLNLTGADRAIILDPDWNPANDNQAVDRCYRIGQKKDVIVYRLVSIGGLEERIYRRQIHKKGMNLQTVESLEADAKEDVSDEKAFQKYFNDSELFELFQYTDDDDECETLKLIMEKDGLNYENTPTNIKHIDFLQNELKDVVKGISLNSNLYTTEEEIDDKVSSQNSEYRNERDLYNELSPERLGRQPYWQSKVVKTQQYEAPSIYQPNLGADVFKMDNKVKEHREKERPTFGAGADVFTKNPIVQEKKEVEEKPTFGDGADCFKMNSISKDQKDQAQREEMRRIHQKIYAQYQSKPSSKQSSDFVRTTSNPYTNSNLVMKQTQAPNFRNEIVGKENKGQMNIQSMFKQYEHQKSGTLVGAAKQPNQIAKY